MTSLDQTFTIEELISNCKTIRIDNKLFFKTRDLFRLMFPSIGETNVSRNMEYVSDENKTYYKGDNDVGRPSLYCSLEGLITMLIRLDHERSLSLKSYLTNVASDISFKKYFIDPNISLAQLEQLKEVVNSKIALKSLPVSTKSSN